MSQLTVEQRVAASAQVLKDSFGADLKSDVLVVLGSGFKAFAEVVKPEVSLSFSEVPFLHQPKVHGHGASIIRGRVGDKSVILCTGRIHLYEGYQPDDVVHAVRALARAGVKRALFTNAAGSVDPEYKPGEVIVLKDHINFTGRNCLVGEAAGLGPQFLDMVEAYDASWRKAIHRLGKTREGVYLGALGPTYETPAETRMFGILGANCVGMSTVLETIAARHMGMRVAAMSLVTNFAGGLAAKVDHEEVLQMGKTIGPKLNELLTHAVTCGAQIS